MRLARRPLVVLLAFAVVLVAAGGGGAAATSSVGPPSARPVEDPLSLLFRRSLAEPAGTSPSLKRLASAAPTWIGGPTTASTGETVTVYVSSDLPPQDGTPQTWADFIAGLDHGSELSSLAAYIAPLDEVSQICGPQALGCYGDNQLIALGETFTDGTTPEEVIRHEYGHHIADHRSNPPWSAIDWGPKNWASDENVCTKVGTGEAYPGDEGNHYQQNPGEAWAETYRILEEQKAGITTGSWPIVSQSYYPDSAALAAAEKDVVQPWTAGKRLVFRHVFTKKSPKVWWVPLTTPLDGSITVATSLPKGGLQGVALVGPDKSSVLKRAYWAGAKVKQLATTVCGQRSFFVRVTQAGAPGRVSVVATEP